MSHDLTKKNAGEIRQAVLERYGEIARSEGIDSCCGGGSACCGSPDSQGLSQASQSVGYGFEQLSSIPAGANLGLGCGNPQAIAALKPGETVLDLGSGAGIDCFLAANAVGKTGRVIGVDINPDMIKRARSNQEKGSYEQVEFRLGEIEIIPVEDNSVDVVISNCVINLSADQALVYNDAFRVLKAGGRLAISDTVAAGPIPDAIKEDLAMHSACISGALSVEQLTAILKAAGFEKIHLQPKNLSKAFIKEWAPGTGVEDFVLSATIEAQKPLVT